MPFIVPVFVPPSSPVPGPVNTPVGIGAQNAVTLPHFAGPFQLKANGKPVVVQQDSPEDIASSLYNILLCPQGAKLDDPTFGIPTPLFGTFPLNWAPALAAVADLEPRAQTTSLAQQLNSLNAGEVDVQLIAQALTQAEVP